MCPSQEEHVQTPALLVHVFVRLQLRVRAPPVGRRGKPEDGFPLPDGSGRIPVAVHSRDAGWLAVPHKETSMKPVPKALALLAGVAGLYASGPAAAAIDWSNVPGKDVVLYYPGQGNWEWALSMHPVEMPGAPFVHQGKSCRNCHEGMEEFLGSDIVTGTDRTQVFADNAVLPPIEPVPIKDKPGNVTVTAKFAHDDANLYVHLDIDEGDQPDAGMDKAFATKVAVMFSPSRSPDVLRTGCYAACHDDDTSNPSETAGVYRTMYLGRKEPEQPGRRDPDGVRQCRPHRPAAGKDGPAGQLHIR